MSNRKIIVLFPILIAVAIVFGVFLGSRMASASYASIFKAKGNSSQHKLNQVLDYIKSDYVDTIQENKIIEETINGILQNLDPHSYYISGERFNEVNDPLEGNFDGIGIEFRIEKDTVVVVNPIAGGPSEKVGLLAGDRIVSANNEELTGPKVDNEKVMKLLKGPKGTQVKIQVKRGAIKKLLDFEITRDQIPIYSVEAFYMMDREVAYIKVIRFAKSTHEEFMNAVGQLKKSGMKKLIVDLRNNSGGYLQAATELADEFLPEGKLIVYTEGKSRKRQNVYSTKEGSLEEMDLGIIINEGSASASEILAGALQDNDRGIIVGRRSFGKGLVQEPMQWSDGSQIRLTVARYYTPTGRSIQKPYTEGLDAYNDEYYNRYESGELLSADSIDFPDSLKYYTEKGKLVYGGGGIMPDVFVPIDTSKGSGYLAKLNYTGMFYQFGFRYTDEHRKEMLANYTETNFEEKFKANPTIMETFYQFVEKQGINFEEKGAKESGKIIENRIRAAIARNLFGDHLFYKILNEEDHTLEVTFRAIK